MKIKLSQRANKHIRHIRLYKSKSIAYKAKSDDESFRGNTWAVKKYITSSRGTFEKMEETCESQSRKAVQMNCLARYFSVSFSKGVLKVCEDFGECFDYNPVYFGKTNHECVTLTIEEFLPGDFQKYINNGGSICLKDLENTEKAETFVHYTYEKSNNRLMVTDLQGVGYHLCDPETGTQTIVEEKSNKSKMLV